MLNVLIVGLFSVLNFLAGKFLAPIFTGISTVFPALGQFFTNFLVFLNYGLQYTGFFIKLLMIPTLPLTILVSFFVTIFVFNLSLRVIGMALAVYHYFKP